MAVVGHREQRDLAAVRQPLDRIEQAANFGVGADDRVTRLLRVDPVGVNDFVRLGEVSQDEARAPLVRHPQVLDNVVGAFALAGVLGERPGHFAFVRHVSGERAAAFRVSPVPSQRRGPYALALGDLMQQLAAAEPVGVHVMIEEPHFRIDELRADQAMIFGPASGRSRDPVGLGYRRKNRLQMVGRGALAPNSRKVRSRDGVDHLPRQSVDQEHDYSSHRGRLRSRAQASVQGE